jgi:secretion/DNA translocation related TadE-like protein
MRVTRGWRRDDGSGTVIAIALIAAIGLGATSVGLGTSAYVARARAQGAADLAALAAAHEARDLRALGRIDSGRDAVCSSAAEVARRNDAPMVGCVVEASGAVTITSEVSLSVWTVTRAARAG